jgi:RNA polymerase sigma-70 factor (ECF subfamily)
MTESAAPAARFEAHRDELVRLAYRMLGAFGEAEDVVQDAFLRWHEAAAHAAIGDDRAYLRAVVTRLALDRLRSARARREVYVGQWLPEPVVADPAQQPEAAVALADDISFALLVALER